jgi:hypothetical protein
MKNIGTCANCKHWTDEHSWDARAVGFKQCSAVRTRWSIEDEAVAGIDKYADDEPISESNYEGASAKWVAAHNAGFKKARAYVQDGSQYRAELVTGPDFFCALWAVLSPGQTVG